MAGNNGAGTAEDFKDITIDGVKALFPEMNSGPLISGIMDSGNPGMRIISDEEFLEDLKALYFEDPVEAMITAAAISECFEFLMNKDGKTKNIEVLQRIQSIKYVCYTACSVKGRMVDKYGQISTNVLTNAYAEGKGWIPLSMPLGRPGNEQQNKDHNPNGKRP
jgi:hypothetical protein